MKELKKRLRQRFERALSSYDQAALIQAEMAERLVAAIRDLGRPFRRVFEIGSGTGLLTKPAYQALKPEFYLASDLVLRCAQYLNGHPRLYFVAGDGEAPSWVKGKFDLIISNATFQWFLDPEKALKRLSRLLETKGVLAFTTFGPMTMQEVLSAAGGRSTHLLGPEKIKEIGQKLYKPLLEEVWPSFLYFQSPKEVLRHIRATGAMGFLPASWSLKALREWQRRYKEFRSPKGLRLTYQPMLFVWERG